MIQTNKLTLSICKQSEFETICNILDIAFNTPEKHWHAKYYNHVISKEPDIICNNYIARINGEIAGAIGIYPQKLKIGDAILKLGSIGSVATLPKFRGHGIMSFMLKESLHIMHQKKYDISWLAGDRFRYENYGWKPSGRRYNYSLRKKDIEKTFKILPKIKSSKAKRNDIKKLSAIYKKLNSRILRSAKNWERGLKRKGYEILYADSVDKNAYLIINKHRNSIVEANGNAEIVIAMILKFANNYKLNTVQLSYSFDTNILGEIFASISEYMEVVSENQTQIITIESTWNKLLPEILKANPFIKKSMKQKLINIKNENYRKILLERALGFFDNLPLLPQKIEEFEWIKPINWWLSDFDAT